MIDLHCHILPGLDDGARNLDESLAMARVAIANGIQTIAATPHVNFDYEVDARAIAHAAGALNVALARNALPLAVLPGAEIALGKAVEMSDDQLRTLGLGGSRCVLIETPYTDGITALGELVFSLQVRGFRPMLAHPERARGFQERPEEVRRLVERGALCCVNSDSLSGGFGSSAHRCAISLLEQGLVHVIASDAHNADRRAPALRHGFEAISERVPAVASAADYYTQAVPAAILAGRPLPPRPEPAPPPSRRSRWRRLLSSG